MPEGTHLDSLEDGALAREFTPDVPSEIWIPAKSPYIAVRPLGELVVKMCVNRRFIDQWIAPTRYERTYIVSGLAVGPHAR